jgi:hypothetical protein
VCRHRRWPWRALSKRAAKRAGSRRRGALRRRLRAAGYATRRDLAALARFLFLALIGLIVFGIIAIFVKIPNGSLIYAIVGS